MSYDIGLKSQKQARQNANNNCHQHVTINTRTTLVRWYEYRCSPIPHSSIPNQWLSCIPDNTVH